MWEGYEVPNGLKGRNFSKLSYNYPTERKKFLLEFKSRNLASGKLDKFKFRLLLQFL